MSSLKPPTAAEKFTGSVATESALVMIGAVTGNPITSLLPILSKSFASERQRKRVETALAEIDATLETHIEALKTITDHQYKLINETILAFLYTTNDHKLDYLRRAVRNAIYMPEIQSQESALISRVIRDISADEADYLMRNFSYRRIQLGGSAENSKSSDTVLIVTNNHEELIVTGLIALGLVIPAGPTFDDSGLMKFSNVVAKLLVLLQKPDV